MLNIAMYADIHFCNVFLIRSRCKQSVSLKKRFVLSRNALPQNIRNEGNVDVILKCVKCFLYFKNGTY